MTQYDPKIIRSFADSLYIRAFILTALYTGLGLLMGWLGSSFGSMFSAPSEGARFAATLIGGLVGFLIGSNKAFLLKLQAQTLLCQAKIEENTH